jgi:hypothetical protein
MSLADVSLRVADAEVVSLTGVDGVRVLERDLAEGETAWVLAGVYHDEGRAPVLLAFLVDMAAGQRAVDALVQALVSGAAVVDVRNCTRLPTLREVQALEALSNPAPVPDLEAEPAPSDDPGPSADDNPEEVSA